jgi:hypothetical protein
VSRELRALKAAIAVVSLAVFLPSLAADGAELSWGEQKLLETFAALEAGTLEPTEATEQCRRNLNAMPDAEAEPLRKVATGLLQVPPSRAPEALCAALVESTLAGEVTAEGIEAAASSDDERIQAFEFGRILRSVYFAHHLTASEEPRP